MADLQLLQEGPETFRVLVGDRRTRRVRLPQHLRRGLCAEGSAPVVVAREVLALLLEQGTLRLDSDAFAGPDPVDLAAAVAAVPGYVDELRARLA